MWGPHGPHHPLGPRAVAQRHSAVSLQRQGICWPAAASLPAVISNGASSTRPSSKPRCSPDSFMFAGHGFQHVSAAYVMGSNMVIAQLKCVLPLIFFRYSYTKGLSYGADSRALLSDVGATLFKPRRARGAPMQLITYTTGMLPIDRKMCIL